MKISTFASGTRSVSSFVASSPSIPGIRTSMITTSGFRRAASSTALAPSAASPTTRICGARWSESRSPSRTTSWSSTISVVISSGMRGPILSERSESCSSRAGGASSPACRSRSGARARAPGRVPDRRDLRGGEVGTSALVQALVARQQLRPVARKAVEEVLPGAQVEMERLSPHAARAGRARGRDDAAELVR